MSWSEARRWILEAEGGYVNDPEDPGGETKYGISKRAYPAVNIAALTADDAAAIYRRDYWEPCECDQLPGPLALAVFDAAVNQGRIAAIRLLQESIEWLTRKRLTVDGIIGPDTVGAAVAAWREDSEGLLAAYLTARAVRYVELIERRPPSVKFRRGWFMRLFRLAEAAMRTVEDVRSL